jgi:uncharacterized protein (DUF433 family)
MDASDQNQTGRSTENTRAKPPRNNKFQFVSAEPIVKSTKMRVKHVLENRNDKTSFETFPVQQFGLNEILEEDTDKTKKLRQRLPGVTNKGFSMQNSMNNMKLKQSARRQIPILGTESGFKVASGFATEREEARHIKMSSSNYNSDMVKFEAYHL